MKAKSWFMFFCGILLASGGTAYAIVVVPDNGSDTADPRFIDLAPSQVYAQLLEEGP